ncbi:solute carrier family 22 member 3 [Episyrphus balteatus]|uniref:solute carrier family 22 member 3 n=1 Tax=Episyrphus balteatus TaxID=286459 RepID=UPI0024863EB5|nr:solute carrier family 22 member 3 [Episyrphus balteatus]
MSPRQEDVIGQVNGDFGRWQLRTILLIFFLKIPSAWLMAAIIYTAPSPRKGEYYCKPPEALKENFTKNWIMVPHSVQEGTNTDREFDIDMCHLYENTIQNNFAATHSNYSNPFRKPKAQQKIIPCEHFQHNSKFESLVTQFDLVCSRQVLVSVSQTFHTIGTLVGGLITKSALNHISPRKLMLVGMVGQIICGNLTGMMPKFSLHVIFRLLTSAFCCFMYTTGQVILTDITGGQAKVIVRCLFELFWSIGLILLPGISIFVDDWSQLYYVISSFTIFLLLLNRWIADSPRWLAKHGKYDEALQELLESATINNKNIPVDLEEQLREYGSFIKHDKSLSYLCIWDETTNWKYVLALHWAWVWASFLYNSMILAIRQFGVDHIHINTVTMGFAEMVGVILGLFLILYTKRHWLWAGISMISTGLLAYLIWLIPSNLGETQRIGLGMILCLGIKGASAVSMSVLTTCSGELVRRNCRRTLMASVVIHSRFWLIFSSLSSALSLIHSLAPLTMFASLAVLNGLLMCYLNTEFWSKEQQGSARVPSLAVYRKSLAFIRMKRKPVMPNKISKLEFSRSISIRDLWMESKQQKSKYVRNSV